MFSAGQTILISREVVITQIVEKKGAVKKKSPASDFLSKKSEVLLNQPCVTQDLYE